MSALIIDGRKIADEIREELRNEITELKERNIIPGLATILISADPASATYVRMKKKACEELGIYTESINHPSNITEQEHPRLLVGPFPNLRFLRFLVLLPSRK